MATPAAAARASKTSSSGGEEVGPSSPQILPADTPFTYPASYAQTEPFTKPHTVGILITLIAAFAYALYSEAVDDAANKQMGGAEQSPEALRRHNIARYVPKGLVEAFLARHCAWMGIGVA